jgi:autotransporter translocation and assembly factor TamB
VAALAAGMGGPSLPETRLSIDARGELDAGRVRGRVEVVDRGARVEADVDAPRSMLGGRARRARGDRAAPIAARLLADNVVLERFAALLPPSLRRARGTARARLRVSGRADAPLLTGEVTLARAGFAPPGRGRADDLDIVARLQGASDELSVWAAARYGDAPLVVMDGTLRAPLGRVLRGERPPREAMAIRVDARVPSFDLARLGGVVGGVVSGAATVRGTVAAPSLTVSARGDRVRVGELAVPKVALEAKADRARAEVAIEARSGVRKGTAPGRLSITARVPLADPAGPIDGSLRASGFAFAWGGVRGATARDERDDITAGARASGVVDAALALSGMRDRPTVRGYVAGRALGLAIAALGRPLHDGRLRIDVSDDALVLSELSLVSGGEGRVTARGRLALDGLRPTHVEATVEAKRLPIIQSGLAAEVDAKLAIRGARTAEGMAGTITVEEGSARLPRLATGRKLQSTGPLEDVVFVDAEAKRRAERRSSDGDGRPKVTVIARIPGPFRVRAPELNADLQGTIEIVVDAQGRVRLGGSAEAQEGTFELLGRRYTIERARVAFTGATPPNPAIDVRLARQLPTARIFIALQGTVSQPTITLGSDPPLYDSAQVLAIVLGGDPDARTPRDQPRVEDRAVGALSGLIIGRLKEQVLPGLPIDVLKVDTGPEGLATTRLEVGKWLGDRVYVSYIRQFGATTGIRRRNSNEGAVQYQVGRGVSIGTRFGDAAVGALDLFWTLRF